MSNNNNNPLEDESKFDTEKPVRIIIVGCGNRGYVYSQYAIERPNRLQVVAVADPIQFRRENVAKPFNLDSQYIYKDWRDILKSKEKIADSVLIATPDTEHCEPAIAFAKKGYHLLVEKPLAITKSDCENIVKAVKENKVILAVCHVLRYSPYNLKIKELIEKNYIGKLLNVQHLEPVGYYHNAHSYVRGNWSQEKTSTFMLMAKSCHDLDLMHFFINKKCKKVSSFGSLSYFKKENKPKEAGNSKICFECPIINNCPYSAKTIYIDHFPWKKNTVVPTKEPTIEDVKEALLNGSPYGRCVYECPNDVVDQQVVILEYEQGITATFSMVSTTADMCIRKTRIFGSHGELECNGDTIIWSDFIKDDKEVFRPNVIQNTRMVNHSSSDYYLIRSFVYAVATNDPSQILSGPDDTLESHLQVFKAEESRLKNKVLSF
ncbi:hypothetical protein CYY_003528 [Polysphondylium violaceum]|uniref:Oxidoreductase n=1 Tax=Polysphondylium violaceum TaxID=133409 RepID=A0A8J4V057_9MYCE|nr:hypothetical protein CYY_003528 [Polysphondylium violaceum]